MGWAKWVALIVLFLALAVGGVMWLALPPREPSYQGKTLSEWLSPYIVIDYAPGEEPTKAQEDQCRDAIRHMGTNAIPLLLRMLKAKDSPAKIKIAELLDRQDFIRIPFSSADYQNRKAEIGFNLLGDIATNAAPALIDIYLHPPSPDSQEIANQVLMSLYPAPCVATPYWMPSGQRAEWYLDAGMAKSSSAPADAISAFSQAIMLDPSDARAYFCRGNAKFQLQDFTGALVDLNKAMELSPRDEEAIFLKAACEYSLKDFNSAETDFTTVINLNTNDNRAYNYRGLVKANRREWDAALADFDQALKVSTNDAEAYRNRALVEAQQKEYEPALADASRSIWLNAHDPVAYLVRGRVKSGLKDYQSAIADYDKAITLNPKDSTAYSARGLARVMLDDFDNAAADVGKAQELNPKNVMTFMVSGLLKAKRGDPDEQALADFEHAVELVPQMPEPCGLLGMFQYKSSQWEPALANLRKALKLGTPANVGEIHAYIWLIRAQSGERDAANEDLEAYLSSPDGAKTNEWGGVTARFFLGSLTESEFRDLATTSAKRPSDVRTQVCESLYYAGMKRKIAGDKTGAAELFQKCLDTKYDNSIAYMNAAVEMRALKQP
jgi:tetratricopeptide (TPR) repeat protein